MVIIYINIVASPISSTIETTTISTTTGAETKIRLKSTLYDIRITTSSVT